MKVQARFSAYLLERWRLENLDLQKLEEFVSGRRDCGLGYCLQRDFESSFDQQTPGLVLPKTSGAAEYTLLVSDEETGSLLHPEGPDRVRLYDRSDSQRQKLGAGAVLRRWR